MTKGNPLQPLTGVVRAMWSITAVAFLLGVVLKVYNAIGETTLCFTSAVVTGQFSAEPQAQGGLRDGVSNYPTELRYCAVNPTGGNRVLGFFDGVPTWFVYAALFFLLLRLLERATDEGVHTAGTADRLRSFGWFTLVAAPAATLVEAFVRTLLLRRAVTYEVSMMEFTRDWTAPWWAVVTGLGMLSLAKIMRSSAEMREELEGTV
ncbi:DUF2975 domain-containing protein [Saccharothrix deserti]|uniref:DUF2975 domain-containing protein n=1 Tax=Saccharothrix deserti TaxID=2593674 RepID=UPI00131B556B|nr:DUF2975 domain-containing protein [Saccharothrix deserti]